jgi:hypothetical protein
MVQFSLHSLECFLNKDGYKCLLIEPSEEFVTPRLALFVGCDRKNRERSLEVTLNEQMLFNQKARKVESSPYCTLQFQYKFPFQANDVTLIDTARLVSFLNRQYALPGLEFDEITGSLFYRHIMLLNVTRVDMETITGTIGIIMLFLEMFTDAVELVASGKMTTNEILETAVLAGAAQTFI